MWLRQWSLLFPQSLALPHASLEKANKQTYQAKKGTVTLDLSKHLIWSLVHPDLQRWPLVSEMLPSRWCGWPLSPWKQDFPWGLRRAKLITSRSPNRETSELQFENHRQTFHVASEYSRSLAGLMVVVLRSHWGACVLSTWGGRHPAESISLSPWLIRALDSVAF